MQRLLAVLLLFSFSLPLIGPALYAGSASQLPACCRAHGKHGCSMKPSTDPGAGLAFRAAGKCPFYPVGRVSPANDQSVMFKDATFVVTSLAAHPAGVVQTEARYRVSFSRAWQKRGPPSFTA